MENADGDGVSECGEVQGGRVVDVQVVLGSSVGEEGLGCEG